MKINNLSKIIPEELHRLRRQPRLRLFFLLVCILIGLYFFGSLYLNQSREPMGAKNHLRPNIPISYLKNIPRQSPTQLIDAPIDSSGCGEKPILYQGETNPVALKSGALERVFYVYLPPHFNNNTPHPLVLAFHGFHDTPWNLERYIGFDKLSNRDNFIIIYPEGSQGLGNVRGWNTGLHPTIRANDLLFVSNMLNTLQANFCIDKNKIYATGFSNGGGFVAELACKLSNRIAAFAPVSGSYLRAFNTCTASRPVPIVEFHGNADAIVPYSGIPNLKEVGAYLWVSGWAKRDGCFSKPQVEVLSKEITRYTWPGCGDKSEVIHYKIIGGHHDWPDVLFPQVIDGKRQYFSTTETIWHFFTRHPLVPNPSV